jgi:D-alanine-D-alanine ligase
MPEGIKSLVQSLSKGQEKEWDLVFNYSEGIRGVAREAQVPALLEAYDIPFTFSGAATFALCLDKAKTNVSPRFEG